MTEGSFPARHQGFKGKTRGEGPRACPYITKHKGVSLMLYLWVKFVHALMGRFQAGLWIGKIR